MKKYSLTQFLVFILLTIAIIYSLGIIHEIAHSVACKTVGLESKITINPFLKNPEYVTSCPGADSLSEFGLFFIRSAPYFLSGVMILLFYLLYRPKNLLGFSFPTAIVIGDWLNILNLTKWYGMTLDYRNDFLQVALLSNKLYLYIMVLFLGITTAVYVKILVRYAQEQGLKLSKA